MPEDSINPPCKVRHSLPLFSQVVTARSCHHGYWAGHHSGSLQKANGYVCYPLTLSLLLTALPPAPLILSLPIPLHLPLSSCRRLVNDTLDQKKKPREDSPPAKRSKNNTARIHWRPPPPVHPGPLDIIFDMAVLLGVGIHGVCHCFFIASAEAIRPKSTHHCSLHKLSFSSTIKNPHHCLSVGTSVYLG